MNTLKEIAKASFFAGIIFLSAAFLLAPKLWWLAACASFPAGYFAFRFDIVYKMIPVAAKRVREEYTDAANGFLEELKESELQFFEWLSLPHPIIFSAMSLAILSTIFSFCNALKENLIFFHKHPISCVLVCLLMSFVFYVVFGICLNILTLIGKLWTRTYVNIMDKSAPDWNEAHNWKKVPLTYRNGFMWIGMGIVAICAFFGFYLWKYIGLIILTLVKVIYKSERVVAGFSGTLGGSVTFLLFKNFSTKTPSPTEFILAVFFGGVISAAIGAASWKVVSERLVPAKVPS